MILCDIIYYLLVDAFSFFKGYIKFMVIFNT